VEKLKELIPAPTIKIPIPGLDRQPHIASESISAIRKDVLAKLHGGDISRKKKLLSKQGQGQESA